QDNLFDDEEAEPIPGDSHSVRQLFLHEQLRPCNDEPFWMEFLDNGVRNELINNRVLNGEKGLWVVIVKPGYEEHSVFRIYKHLANSRFSPQFQVHSVFGLASSPGRIFFEADSRDTVHDICQGLPNVFPSKIFAISVDPSSILNVPNTYRPMLGSWVRLRKGVFKGDIAVVTKTSPSLLIDVKVVPWVVYEP
ncbi:hypothetical protein K443DRAFT_35486, partial [Laccaria amethystina LaAM-08-1]